MESSVCCSNRNLALLLLNSEGLAKPIRLQNFWLNAFRFILESFNSLITLCDWSGKRSNQSWFLWPTCKAVLFGLKERVGKEKSCPSIINDNINVGLMHTLVMNESTDIFLSFLRKLIQMIMIFYLLGIGGIISFCVASTGGIWVD